MAEPQILPNVLIDKKKEPSVKGNNTSQDPQDKSDENKKIIKLLLV